MNTESSFQPKIGNKSGRIKPIWKKLVAFLSLNRVKYYFKENEFESRAYIKA